MTKNCTIGLDLGTTAFKSAPVDGTGLLADPTVVSYDLDYHAGAVTFDPESYLHIATAALAGAIRSARAAGLQVTAIGISSQAQTYIPLDAHGHPMQPAIVWTDGRAVSEAQDAAQAIPDFVSHSGFRQPLPEMFMPKVRQFTRSEGARAGDVWKYVLLNEYLIYRLTGVVYGDTTNQGMSGFYHITERRWSQAALAFAGIAAGQLAETAGAAQINHPLTADWCRSLGIGAAPVYSCGNDQSCSAAGVGLTKADDILCNFGTAMVIYALKDNLPRELAPRQIAGINPLTDRYFLLGLESECGNMMDWAFRLMYSELTFTQMMEDALRMVVDTRTLPTIQIPGGGRIEIQGLNVGCERRHLVRALLDLYAQTFGELYADVSGERRIGGSASATRVAGGLSRSDAWLEYLSRRFGLTFKRAASDQAALPGIAKIIERRTTVNGTSI